MESMKHFYCTFGGKNMINYDQKWLCLQNGPFLCIFFFKQLSANMFLPNISGSLHTINILLGHVRQVIWVSCLCFSVNWSLQMSFKNVWVVASNQTWPNVHQFSPTCSLPGYVTRSFNSWITMRSRAFQALVTTINEADIAHSEGPWMFHLQSSLSTAICTNNIIN